MIQVLPTNCQFAVVHWEQLFSKVNIFFKVLSEKYDDYAVVYEHLLPFIYEECHFNILQFFDVVMKAIKYPNKQKLLNYQKNGKEYYYH